MGIRLILGIGNPGARYEGTRHNLGFETVRAVARDLDIPLKESRFLSKAGTGCACGGQVVLLTPQTFVNNSGFAGKSAADYYGVSPQSIMIVGDDLNLPAGKIRIRTKGSSGGHNGLQSVIDVCRTDRFPRIRIGIAKEHMPDDIVSFVLGRYEGEEKEILDKAVLKAAEAVTCWLSSGIEKSMSVFN